MPFPPPGDLSEIEPTSPAFQANSLPLSYLGIKKEVSKKQNKTTPTINRVPGDKNNRRKSTEKGQGSTGSSIPPIIVK